MVNKYLLNSCVNESVCSDWTKSITLQIFVELLWGAKPNVLTTMKIIKLTGPIHGRALSLMTLKSHPMHFSAMHVHSFWHLHVTSTSQIKLLKLHVYDACWSPTHFPKGPGKELCAVDSSCPWAGTRRAPDGGFCGGLPFILGCKQPEWLCYKWVIYSLLPKSFHGLCYQRLPACLAPLIFVGAVDQRKESCRLGHLHVGFHTSCEWVPASPLPQMSFWPSIFAAHYCSY